ncbi:hypothetical protein NFI96_021830 [Prochilodus magdalenae]|nr:hypothetical protein NFI96_021830 [Prochilodus magdalenae]
MEIMAVNMLTASPATATLPPSPCLEDPGLPLGSLDSEDYVFVEPRHPNKVLEGLNSLRLNNAFCDVTLCCGGQEFPCHRIVLASFSSYFQAYVTALDVTALDVMALDVMALDVMYLDVMALEVMALEVMALDVMALDVMALDVMALDVMALDVMYLDVMALEVMALEVMALEVMALDVMALDVMALEVMALDVMALDVMALDVMALDVMALDVMALDVMALDVMALDVMALDVMALDVMYLDVMYLDVMYLDVIALEVMALDVMALDVMALEVMALDVMALDVMALDVMALDVMALEVMALEVMALDVMALDVMALEVMALDVMALDVMALDVMALDVMALDAMFSTDLMESRQERVAINGVEPQMIGMLVSYAYTAEIVISKANVQALLAAANLLDVMAVREACCRFMERQMDEINCVGIHCFAEAHSCKELERRSMEYIQQHFSTVCQQEEFLSLCADKLTEIISSDHLNVPKEETVFEATMLWLEKSASRRQSFEKVLEHIRLPLISPYYIHDVIESLDVVKESPKCQKLISEAKDYLLLQDRRGELYSPRARPRRATGTAEVIVTVGGEDDKVVLRSVESFDPLTSQWKSLACLPFAVSKHGLVVSGSMLYLAGGEFPDGSASREMWRYDPCFDSWLEMAPMNVARSELGKAEQTWSQHVQSSHSHFLIVAVQSLVMLDGYVFAVGGWEGRSRLDSVECYNPHTNTWQFVESVKMAVTSPAVVALDGLLYVTGGAVLEDGDGTDLAQVYNPKTHMWTEVAPMQIARSGSAACTLKGKIYVIGGWHASTENTDKVECYDPKSNKWTMCAPMKERRYRPGVAVVDGKIYVLGGEEGWDRYHDTIERYCEETDTWEIVGEMPTSRSWLSCVSLQLRKDTHAASHPGAASETEFPVD